MDPAGKLAQFKVRCNTHGQAVTLEPFVADPSGSYVDDIWGHPDPDDADYPDTPPDASYGTAETVRGFLFPSPGDTFVRTEFGDEVQVRMQMHVPGDQTISFRDRVTLSDGDVLYVARIGDWSSYDTLVVRELFLVEEVPQGS